MKSVSNSALIKKIQEFNILKEKMYIYNMTHIEIEKITISGIKVGQGDKKTRTYI